MDNLGQAGCVEIIIDRINKDLSERQFGGFGVDSKCDTFPDGKPSIGDPKFDGGHCEASVCCDTFAGQNGHHLKNDSPKRNELSANNPVDLISDLVLHGRSMDGLALKPLLVGDLNAVPIYQPTNQPVNYRNDESQRSAIDLNNLNSSPVQKSGQLQDNQLTSSQLSGAVEQFEADRIGLIDAITAQPQVSVVDQDLKALPMSKFSSFACDLSSDSVHSNQKRAAAPDSQPCVLVQPPTEPHTTEQRKTAERNEELVANKRVTNGSDDCSSQRSKCKCAFRYSRFIEELPSLGPILRHSQSSDQNRFQTVLHLIQGTKERIAQLNKTTNKQIELDAGRRLTNFDAVVESNKRASISNDFYLELGRSLLSDLVRNCLDGNDALLIQTGSTESHDVLLGPAGLFSFAVKSLFDGLKGMHRKFVVRCRAAQFGSEQFIDLFAKHKLSRPPSGPSKFLNGNSILNRLNEIRCSNLKRSVQAIELAINNNRKLLDLTSSDESVLLITFQIYQYEVKESALDASGKTAFGGCSRLHLLDVGSSSLASTCRHLTAALNESPADNAKLHCRTNKMWPKFNEKNKIAELFQEFVVNQSCRISAVGSFENEPVNSKNLHWFCDLAEQFQSANERMSPVNRKKNEPNSDSMNSKSRRNSIKCRQSVKSCSKSLKYSPNAGSLPRRLSKCSRRSSEESRESIKKIVLKRQLLQISHRQTEEQIWIDGPNCRPQADNESADGRSNVDRRTPNHNSSVKSSNSSSRSVEPARLNDDLMGKQKRIENWIKQQQMAGKQVVERLQMNDRASSNRSLNSKASNNLNHKKAGCHLDATGYLANGHSHACLSNRIEDLNSQLNSLYNTISRRPATRGGEESPDLNQNNLIRNLNGKESPFKYPTASLTRREHRNGLLNKLNLKTNYQEQFKLTCSSEDEFSDKDDEDEENEQKLIEENLHFFSTNFFRRNFQLSSTTLSEDGKSSLYADDRLDGDSANRRARKHQRKLSMDLESRLDRCSDDEECTSGGGGPDLATEPPKQLKLEQFLRQLINSTLTSQADLNHLSLNSLDSSLTTNDETKKMSTRHCSKTKQTERADSKGCLFKNNKSNVSSSSSSGVSSKETTAKHAINSINSINSKVDFNSIKSYGYKESHELLNNKSSQSSGHGTISEAESGLTSLTDQKNKFVALPSTKSLTPVPFVRTKQPGVVLSEPKAELPAVETCKVIDSKPKSLSSKDHQTSNSPKNSELILQSNGKTKSAICRSAGEKAKNQTLFCCGLF